MPKIKRHLKSFHWRTFEKRREEALAQIVKDAQDMGLYDDPEPPSWVKMGKFKELTCIFCHDNEKSAGSAYCGECIDEGNYVECPHPKEYEGKNGDGTLYCSNCGAKKFN